MNKLIETLKTSACTVALTGQAFQPCAASSIIVAKRGKLTILDKIVVMRARSFGDLSFLSRE